MKSWVSTVIVLMAAIAYSFFSEQSIGFTDAFRLFGGFCSRLRMDLP